ncbi:MAG: hypothetical protein U1F43_17030 [Myxococcota bacterium]
MRTPSSHDQRAQALFDRLAPEVVARMSDVQATRARGLLRELLSQWAYEAGAHEGSDAIYDILEQDLRTEIAGKGADQRFDVLWGNVLTRRLRDVSGATFALGQRVIDGTVADAEAKARGRELLSQTEVLAAEVRTIVDGERRLVLERQVQDAMLEALYAIEGKAMSRRLDRYRLDGHGAMPKPNVTP